MPYRMTRQAHDAARRMPPEGRKRLKAALAALADGHLRGIDVKRLEPPGRRPPPYRLRIGSWRAAYRHDPDVLLVLQVFPRREGYGWMERMR